MAKHDLGQSKTVSKGTTCPKCNTVYTPTLFVNSIKTDSGSYRFNRSQVKVCKCNEKEIYN